MAGGIYITEDDYTALQTSVFDQAAADDQRRKDEQAAAEAQRQQEAEAERQRQLAIFDQATASPPPQRDTYAQEAAQSPVGAEDAWQGAQMAQPRPDPPLPVSYNVFDLAQPPPFQADSGNVQTADAALTPAPEPDPPPPVSYNVFDTPQSPQQAQQPGDGMNGWEFAGWSGPDQSNYQQAYGAAQWAGGPANHRGVDIRLKGAADNGRGQSYTPFQSGTVVQSGDMGAGGTGLLVQTDDGLYNWYFHNERNLVRPGDRVEAGVTPIGVLGDTGSKNFPHVHYEVSANTAPGADRQNLDPAPFMRSSGQQPTNGDAFDLNQPPPFQADSGTVRPSPLARTGDRVVDFVNRLEPTARRVAAETGIPWEVLVAIPANETGWGTAEAGNNLFGIKGDNRGKSVVSPTWEEVGGQVVNITDRFRAYDSDAESMRDFAAFLNANPRYGPALGVLRETGDPAAFVRAVRAAGYATDSKWADKIVSIMGTVNGVATGANNDPIQPARAAQPAESRNGISAPELVGRTVTSSPPPPDNSWMTPPDVPEPLQALQNAQKSPWEQLGSAIASAIQPVLQGLLGQSQQPAYPTAAERMAQTEAARNDQIDALAQQPNPGMGDIGGALGQAANAALAINPAMEPVRALAGRAQAIQEGLAAQGLEAPGFGGDVLTPEERATLTPAQRQRLALQRQAEGATQQTDVLSQVPEPNLLQARQAYERMPDNEKVGAELVGGLATGVAAGQLANAGRAGIAAVVDPVGEALGAAIRGTVGAVKGVAGAMKPPELARAGVVANAGDIEQQAARTFGTTSLDSEAGYVMRDGQMLDFSGKAEGGTPGYRSNDHRDIGRVTGRGGTEGMNQFMSDTGAIRFSNYDGSVAMEIPGALTPTQRNVLLGLPRTSESVVVDVMDPITGSARASESFDFPQDRGRFARFVRSLPEPKETPTSVYTGRPFADAAEQGRLGALARESGNVGRTGRMAGVVQASEPGAGIYYHGTGGAFDTPDPGKFDPNGLFGPGYYVTSDARVAGSYANIRGGFPAAPPTAEVTWNDAAEVLREVATNPRVPASSREWLGMVANEAQPGRMYSSPGYLLDKVQKNVGAATWAKIEDAVGARVEGYARPTPNVRPVEVPPGLRLLNADAVATSDDAYKFYDAVRRASPQAARDLAAKEDWQTAAYGGGKTGIANLYEEARSALTRMAEDRPSTWSRGDELRTLNEGLQAAGYDGIRYSGGKRIPMRADDGSAIEHEALVIFPESLPKIKNAYSRTAGGLLPTGTSDAAAPIARSVATGAVAGAGQEFQQTGQVTPEGVALGALGGAARMGAGRLAGSAAGVRAVGQAARVIEETRPKVVPTAAERVLDSGLIVPRTAADVVPGPRQVLGPKGQVLSTVGDVGGGIVRQADAPMPTISRETAKRLPNLTKLDIGDDLKATLIRTTDEIGPQIDAMRQGKITHRQLVEDLAPRLGMTADDFMKSKVGQAYNNAEMLTLRAAVVDRSARLAEKTADIARVDALSPVEKVKLLNEMNDFARLAAVGRGAPTTIARALNQQKVVLTREMARSITGGNEAVAAERAIATAKNRIARVEAVTKNVSTLHAEKQAATRTGRPSTAPEVGAAVRTGQASSGLEKQVAEAYDELAAWQSMSLHQKDDALKALESARATRAAERAAAQKAPEPMKALLSALKSEIAAEQAYFKGNRTAWENMGAAVETRQQMLKLKGQGEGQIAWLEAQRKAAQAEATKANQQAERIWQRQSNVEQRQNDQAARLLEKLGDREVTDQILDSFLKAQRSGDPIAVAKFMRGLASGSWLGRASILRYGSMLSGSATHLINTTGNLLNLGMNLALKPASVPLDILQSKLTGNARTRYWAEILPQTIGHAEGGLDGLAEAGVIIRHGISPQDAARLDSWIRGGFGTDLGRLGRKSIGSVTVNEAVDLTMELPLRMLGAADAIVRGMARGGETRALATRRAIQEGLGGEARAARVQEIMANLEDYPDIMDAAEKGARRVVLQEDRGKTGRAVQEFARLPLINLEVPFARTPWALAAQGAGMTPAGFAAAIKSAREGEVGPAVDRATRALFGTAIAGATWAMAASGLTTSGYPEDQKTRSTLPPGWREWSFRRVDADGTVTYIPMQNFGVLAVPMVLGSILNDAGKHIGAGQGMEKVTVTAIGQMGDYFASTTILQGIRDAVNAIKDPDRYGVKASETIVTQFVPFGALQRQIQRAQSMPARDPDGWIEAIKAVIPPLAESVPERTNALGDTVYPGQTAAAAFVSPLRFDQGQDDPTLRVFRQADVGISGAPKTLSLVKDNGSTNVPLTREEQAVYEKEVGNYLKIAVGKYDGNEQFAAKPLDYRQKWLSGVSDRAREAAAEKIRRAIPLEEKRRRLREWTAQKKALGKAS